MIMNKGFYPQQFPKDRFFVNINIQMENRQ